MEGLYYRTNKDLLIVPLGDIQWAGHTDEVAIGHLQKFILKALAKETDTLEVKFLGYGDYIDYESPSNRMIGKNKYDTAKQVEEDAAIRLCQELMELVLRPTIGKWLGMVTGHHYKDLISGGTTDTWLCERLKTKHLGDEGHITLSFTRPSSNAKGAVELYIHHGAGAGRSDWAPLVRLSKMFAKHEADIYIQGHLHKECTAKLQRTKGHWNNGVFQLKDRTVRLVGCGGWLKGRVENRKVGGVAKGTYVEKAMLDPVALGAPLIHIHPHWSEPTDLTMGRKPSGGIRQHRIWDPEIWTES